ncbi:acyltransferase family protein [Nonomuraea lactucae]|uniref:acyltransferase family protein n=1 Tax=Nonomuraea lactucae TaxID=2249762 RepID=UPI0013B3A268|nr:acyltransferase [Nonomuraea lactucae]
MTERLYELDGLRFLAALCVVFFHYTFSGWAGGTSPVEFPVEGTWSKYGYLGVDLFFAISGFVVLMSAWGRGPRAFVVSRVVRLYPAYWVGIALTAVVTLTLGAGVFTVTPGQILANLTMFQAVADVPNVDVVYWTLWSEMRFYMLIFVLTCVGMTRARVMAFLWGWLALTFAVEAGLVPRVADLMVQAEFSHYFIAGMGLFLVHRFGLTWQLAALLPLCLGNAVYRALGFADAVGRRYGVSYDHAIIVGVVVAIFAVMALVAFRVIWGRAVGPWLETAGALTYPLYLLHAHIGFILFARLGGSVNRYVLLYGLVVVMCLAAYAVHRFVERPAAPALKGLLLPRREPANAT